MNAGFATSEGTQRYVSRFGALSSSGHFRSPRHVGSADAPLLLSSLGIGTYLGDTTEDADSCYVQSITAALRGGINLVDTAINYRHQRSERNVGATLANLINAEHLRRDEVFVCTKAGYLSFDGQVPDDPKAYLQQNYVRTGIADAKEIVAGMHCISPRFLKDQIERSRRNLGLKCIDLFYLHNPESQVNEVPGSVFQARLRAAFEALEELVAGGSIRWYGIASWNAFRVAPDEPGYMSLENCLLTAQACSKNHHLRFIQLPFNLAMTEAWAAKHQAIEGEWMSALEAAQRLGLTVIASSTLMQTRLAQDLPQRLRQEIAMLSDAANAIQFVRSAPGILSALIGMGHPQHVLENLETALTPRMDASRWKALFRH